MRLGGGVIPARSGVVAGVLALLAVALMPLFPAYAQGSAGKCSNGTAVPDPSSNPGLVSDCEALLEARDTLAGSGSLNWSADTPMDQWDGITVGGFPQRVMELSLSERQLTGEIPPELGRLAELETLNLSSNELVGNIPGELGRLGNLENLTLSENVLSGKIPAELGNLSELVHLELNWNRLSGPLPPELLRLSSLSRLLLHTNRLTGRIPPGLGRLGGLTLLDLNHNEFTGPIPSELGRLSSLKRLQLDHNQLTGEIPSDLVRLADLRILDLRGNQLTGKIPSDLVRLADLRILDLRGNQLTGKIPSDLVRLADLSILLLGENKLTGQIPPELSRLSKLSWLLLNDNQLTGEIPSGLGRLADLSLLVLRNNQLTGEIPSDLGRLADLRILDLRNNQLTGEIPEKLGSLSHLVSLYLSDNKLTGCIPAGLRNLELNHDFYQLDLPYCDVLLDDLVVSPGALAPSFDRYHTEYATEVSTPIVTVRPISLYNPTLQFLGADGHELADADDTVPGMQIDTGTVFTRVTIMVVAADGRATHTYTIGIRRVLGAPTIAAVEAGGGYMTVSWAAPDEFAEARTASYDLRYIQTADDDTLDSNWTVMENAWTDSSVGSPRYAITGLSAGTQYEVQVRAVDREGGAAAWSASVTGTPTTPSACVTGGAVTGAINPGIVSDCESLLAARDVLGGSSRLNWSAGTRIEDWDGVTVGGTPPRVVGLSLNSRGLDGTIPAELGDLTGLRRLHLFENQLTGPIPAELGRLSSLSSLDLSDNRLTGQIPVDFARLSNLRSLDLSGNRLTGAIPPQLGDLQLDEVDLSGNDLRGCFPPRWSRHGGPACFAAEGTALTVDARHLLRGARLKIMSVEDAVNGTVTLDGSTITYTHDGSETTTGGFTYTVFDGTNSTTALVTIRIVPVNDPPTAAADAVTVQEGGTVSVQVRSLLDNDSDAEGDTLSISAVGDATNGVVTLDGSSITYSHDGSETATGGFTYTVTDGTDSTTALVTVTVSPVNDPPVGVDDAFTVREGDTISIEAGKLLENDTDAEGDTLSITAVGDVTNGIVTLDGSRIIYAHDGSETIAASFTYTVNDGTDSGTALATITVSPVNDPPVGVDDALAVREGGAVSIDARKLLENDTDAEDDTLSITAVGDATDGIVTLDGSTVIYRHDGSETNAGSFAYTISDGTDSTSVLVTITVSPVNDPPLALGDALSVAEGGTVAVRAQRLTSNDSDAEGDPLRITDVRDAINGVVTLRGDTITYEHDGAETTSGSFAYTVSDGIDSTTALVTVAVRPVNDPPTGVDDTLAVQEGGTISVAYQQLLANDTDAEGDALRITAVGDAINGVVTLDGNTITYAHDGSETLTGSFTYTVADRTDSATVLVAVTVSPVDDLPVLLLVTVALGAGLLVVGAVAAFAIRRTRRAA